MQMAGGSAEQEELKAELQAAKELSAASISTADIPTNTVAATAPNSANSPQAPPQKQSAALSFLSPPKPKFRRQTMALSHATHHHITPATATNTTKVQPAVVAAAAVIEKVEKKEKTLVEKETPAQPVIVVENKVKVAPAQPLTVQVQQQTHQPATTINATTNNNNNSSSSSLGLLKVSARGPKPMPAPWQQQNGAQIGDKTDKVHTQSSSSVSLPAAPPHQEHRSSPSTVAVIAVSPSPKKKVVDQNHIIQQEIKQLRAALAEATSAKEAAVQEVAALRAELDTTRKTVATMELQIEEVEEDAKTEATIRIAAEKRMHSLEMEVEELRAAATGGAEGFGKELNKIGDGAVEVEGQFGLVEVQLEALLVAANALSQQVASGKGMAQRVVESVGAAQAAVGAAGVEGQTRKTRTRRKSAWRG